MKELSISSSSSIPDTNMYNKYEFQGIKVFILKTLKTNKKIDINLKYNIPIIGPIWDIKGVKPEQLI
ncbi:hypothetical protein [Clostridiisalibacter paucivorans]|uniref:hypothetical protein n=1 Tax=Clostridiisalibacter paucivorans TaxID=408753 RepID=UPI00047E2012|nr:hypothetical protein [Clostridiisalibacter paucivorans]